MSNPAGGGKRKLQRKTKMLLAVLSHSLSPFFSLISKSEEPRWDFPAHSSAVPAPMTVAQGANHVQHNPTQKRIRYSAHSNLNYLFEIFSYGVCAQRTLTADGLSSVLWFARAENIRVR